MVLGRTDGVSSSELKAKIAIKVSSPKDSTNEK